MASKKATTFFKINALLCHKLETIVHSIKLFPHLVAFFCDFKIAYRHYSVQLGAFQKLKIRQHCQVSVFLSHFEFSHTLFCVCRFRILYSVTVPCKLLVKCIR